MDFFRLRCFQAVAEQKNLTRAAELLNISQPGMSFQIRELEKELNLQLFQRDGKRLFLTLAGEVLYQGTPQLLDSFDHLLERARAVAGDTRKKPLVIGYHGPVTWAGVPDFVAAFSRHHPEIELVVMQQHWKELAEYLKIGALDVAFLSTDEVLPPSQAETIHLFHELTSFAVAESSPLARLRSLTLEDIKGQRICMNNHPSVSMDNCIAHIIESGIAAEDMVFSSQMEDAIAMAACGQGITSVPRSFKTNATGLRYVDFDSGTMWLDYSLSRSLVNPNPAAALFLQEAAMVAWPYNAEGNS